MILRGKRRIGRSTVRGVLELTGQVQPVLKPEPFPDRAPIAPHRPEKLSLASAPSAMESLSATWKGKR